MPIEAIIFYLVLIDSVFANIIAWSGKGEWLNTRFQLFGRFFPISRGWTTYYLVLVLWIGFALMRLGVI